MPILWYNSAMSSSENIKNNSDWKKKLKENYDLLKKTNKTFQELMEIIIKEIHTASCRHSERNGAEEAIL